MLLRATGPAASLTRMLRDSRGYRLGPSVKLWSQTPLVSNTLVSSRRCSLARLTELGTRMRAECGKCGMHVTSACTTSAWGACDASVGCM